MYDVFLWGNLVRDGTKYENINSTDAFLPFWTERFQK